MALTRAPKQLNADGSVNIYCSECGEYISTQIYRGFSSAICERCFTGKVSPVQPFDPKNPLVPAPADPMLLNNDPNLPPAQREREGMVKFLFRALGFSKKPVTTPVPSEQAAKRKKYKPIFSDVEGEDVAGKEK